MSKINIISDKFVKDIMTENPSCIEEDKCIDEAAELINEISINALPVVDEKGKLTGIITLGDLLLKATRTPLFDMWTHGIYDNTEDLLDEYKKIVGTHIKDVMSEHPFTCSKDDPVSRAATIMYRRKVKQLPVVDDEKNVIGIITASDVVRLLYSNES